MVCLCVCVFSGVGWMLSGRVREGVVREGVFMGGCVVRGMGAVRGCVFMGVL